MLKFLIYKFRNKNLFNLIRYSLNIHIKKLVLHNTLFQYNIYEKVKNESIYSLVSTLRARSISSIKVKIFVIGTHNSLISIKIRHIQYYCPLTI